MRALAVDIYLTSDRPGPSVVDFPRLLAAAGVLWHLPAEELVWRATGLPARAMRIADSVGTIEAGKVADLVLLDGDLREDITAIGRVSSVYQAGTPIA
jgi:imidazolonepropionase-like amidohydrolase